MDYQQFAAEIGCSSRSVRRWVESGKLSAPPFTDADIPTAIALRNKFREQRRENLTSHTAPDLSGGSVTISCKLTPDDADWLRSQPEGASYHLRQAVRLYRQSFGR